MFLWPIVNFALWHHHWIERESIEQLVLDHAAVAPPEAAVASV
jgi:hypothetical protein